MLKFSKKKQLAYKYKPKIEKEGFKKESPLQAATERYCEMRMLSFIRIPDVMWFWVKKHFPLWLKNIMSKYLAGWPDCTIIEPIKGTKYSLTLLVELKSKDGKLQGKQKKMAHALNYQVIRTPEKVIAEINEFLKFKDFLEEKIKEWQNQQ